MHETLTFCDLIDAGNAQSQLVLYAIARNSDWQTGSCWADQDTLAKMSKCSDRTIRTHLQKLQKDGIITREERRSENGGRLPDRITLVGYADWIKSLREGGRVEKPVSVSKYHLPENLSGGVPENLSPPPGRQASGNIVLISPTTTTTKEVDSSTQEVKGSDLDALQASLFEAADACLDNPANCLGLLNLSIPQIWLGSGCDLEKDIVPTLRAIAQRSKGKRIRTWAYFTDAVLETKAKREAALATVTNTTTENKTQSSGISWVKVEAGTAEYDAWKEFYRSKNNPLAAFMEKTSQAIFVVGKEPREHGDSQLAYLEQQARDTQNANVDRRAGKTAYRATR